MQQSVKETQRKEKRNTVEWRGTGSK